MSIESPCNLVCTIDPKSGFCFGCGRTIDEISAWAGYSTAIRQEVIDSLPARLAGIERPQRRLTRRSRLARESPAGKGFDE